MEFSIREGYIHFDSAVSLFGLKNISATFCACGKCAGEAVAARRKGVTVFRKRESAAALTNIDRADFTLRGTP